MKTWAGIAFGPPGVKAKVIVTKNTKNVFWTITRVRNEKL
jgi:hypothetical protein